MIKLWPNSEQVWPPVCFRGSGSGQQRILFTKAWIYHWSWLRRPAFLKPHAQRHTTLFAGPWVGEFGWELMNWQGLVRALRPHYDHLIVSSRASSAALYKGVADTFIPHEIKGVSNSHVTFQIENPAELDRVLRMMPKGADLLFPLRYVPSSAQQFVRLGDPSRCGQKIDVLFHARGRGYAAGRNWPMSRWTTLAEMLRVKGYSVGSIGLSRDAGHVPGTHDLRDQPLGRTLDTVSASRLVVGPSSGPLHLASLCGVPHLVWTDNRTYGMGLRSRDKYETAWNPLRTPVRVLDEYGFDPPAEVVQGLVSKLLQGNL